MERIPWYLLIVAAVFCISLVIGGYALVRYTPDNIIPRERVCIPQDLPSGALTGYWHAVAETTGIEPGSAELVRLKAGLGSGGSIDKIELEFMAESGGTTRYYEMLYRSDRERCGWSDGIAYPEENHVLPKPLRIGPETALMAVGQIRLADVNPEGTPLLLETHRFPDPVFGPGRSAMYEIGFLWNGTPICLPATDPDPLEMLPFSLTVARENTPG